MRCAPLACVLLIVLSGCAAPITSGPETDSSALETQTPSTGPNALPTNESRVYDRVATLLDSNVSQPSLRTVNASRLGETQYRLQQPFYSLLLNVSDTTVKPPAAYYNSDSHEVVVVLHRGVPANATNESRLELVLAHEYAHAMTMNDPRYRQTMMSSVADDTTDALQIRRMMKEGTGVYVAEAYADRYLGNVSSIRRLAREYRQSRPLMRYVLGPYVFGARYFDRNLDSPTNLPDVYRRPPETTEQLIHGYDISEERPAPLDVTVESRNGDTTGQRDTLGELFVRDMLGGQLDESRAARAASGWGNDSIVTVWNYDSNESNQRSYAWTIRWDDERNATEFTRAFAEYMDRRGQRIGEGKWKAGDRRFRFERVSDETVVVFIGGADAVNRLSATGTDANVSVAG
ncbi:hypothetical protein M0R88_11530 [Halorussus gelatinilyticus]|uniref:Uncharacterized protein n=1 Tax=Halorussus gelatinilyticus TaxID=2937524 RepID=A0A8U0IDN0_9EURY|nr:hypothetical protein [Halorussus gelatinilyticus]UPV99156.1 hypothetical protein M0R88_11530 [Halorussus gelatinilyticus]